MTCWFVVRERIRSWTGQPLATLSFCARIVIKPYPFRCLAQSLSGQLRYDVLCLVYLSVSQQSDQMRESS